MKKTLTTLVVVAGLMFVAGYLIQGGMFAEYHGPGTITDAPRPAEITPPPPAPPGHSKQILFGDLHVHTTMSLDAHQWSLPLFQGTQGTHPIADACDFARYCSGLDFWSINDHAGVLTPRNWSETKQAIRDCNAVTDPQNPDVVAFLGYEWTQVGNQPSNHYGHKNVVFRHTEEGKVPSHPIAASNPERSIEDFRTPMLNRIMLPLFYLGSFQEYINFNRYMAEIFAVPECPPDIPFDELPLECRPYASTPGELFGMLDDWGGEAMVIPHGNTWGFYTPRGTTWDKQLNEQMHDPDRQRLIEIYSGHGNSEEYQSWRSVTFNESGEPECPPKTDAYYPGCRRAADIIRQRCQQAGGKDAECEDRAQQAIEDFFASDAVMGFNSVPGTDLTDWQDSGFCRECWQPAYRYRPGGSTQYALAIRNFEQDESEPDQFRFGIIASSDNHSARPGTGYKEFFRRGMTESRGVDPATRGIAIPEEDPQPRSRVWRHESRLEFIAAGLKLFERQSSFFVSGGLVAVHSKNRTRDEIWDALNRREVYGTSGPRFSLWFDLINPQNNEEPLPMGSHSEQSQAPAFRVTALGDFKQQPGCPDYATSNLAPERLQKLCLGECYHPGDERHAITRIEVIRIQPQQYENEPLEKLILDTWKTVPCPADGNGCTVEFSDPDYDQDKRDTLYYVRAIAEPKPTINGNLAGYQYDANGNYQGMERCDQAGPGDCLAKTEPRAWSSPIYLSYKPAATIEPADQAALIFHQGDAK